MPDPQLDQASFTARYKQLFADPVFDTMKEAVDQIALGAWDAYANHRKSPVTRKAGSGYSDPDYDLAIDWIAASDAVRAAQQRHDNAAEPPRILIINGSSRSEHSCPGEMSKSWRMTQIAAQTCDREGIACDVLDLSRLSAEYGRHIHPCKACFSTSPALCHWPCSCYPNYSLG